MWRDPPGIHKPLQKKRAIFLGEAGLPEGVMFKLRPGQEKSKARGPSPAEGMGRRTERGTDSFDF